MNQLPPQNAARKQPSTKPSPQELPPSPRTNTPSSALGKRSTDHANVSSSFVPRSTDNPSLLPEQRKKRRISESFSSSFVPQSSNSTLFTPVGLSSLVEKLKGSISDRVMALRTRYDDTFPKEILDEKFPPSLLANISAFANAIGIKLSNRLQSDMEENHAFISYNRAEQILDSLIASAIDRGELEPPCYSSSDWEYAHSKLLDDFPLSAFDSLDEPPNDFHLTALGFRAEPKLSPPPTFITLSDSTDTRETKYPKSFKDAFEHHKQNKQISDRLLRWMNNTLSDEESRLEGMKEDFLCMYPVEFVDEFFSPENLSHIYSSLTERFVSKVLDQSNLDINEIDQITVNSIFEDLMEDYCTAYAREDSITNPERWENFEAAINQEPPPESIDSNLSETLSDIISAYRSKNSSPTFRPLAALERVRSDSRIGAAKHQANLDAAISAIHAQPMYFSVQYSSEEACDLFEQNLNDNPIEAINRIIEIGNAAVELAQEAADAEGLETIMPLIVAALGVTEYRCENNGDCFWEAVGAHLNPKKNAISVRKAYADKLTAVSETSPDNLHDFERRSGGLLATHRLDTQFIDRVRTSATDRRVMPSEARHFWGGPEHMALITLMTARPFIVITGSGITIFELEEVDGIQKIKQSNYNSSELDTAIEHSINLKSQIDKSPFILKQNAAGTHFDALLLTK